MSPGRIEPIDLRGCWFVLEAEPGHGGPAKVFVPVAVGPFEEELPAERLLFLVAHEGHF